MRRLYFDHNATCPLRGIARAALVEALDGPPLGNPSSAHAEGRRARALLERARERLAAAIGCGRDEIVFTSGGTESNALALGAAGGGAVLHTPIEHPSLLAPLRASGHGTPLPLNGEGRADPADVSRLARGSPRPALLSAALANHETGVVQDVSALARAAREAGLLAHTDASQATGKLPFAFRELGADLMTVSAHKLGGPPGIGALVIRRGCRIPPLLRGGAQEAGLRAGTEAAALAAAFAAAAEEAVSELPGAAARWGGWTAGLLDALRLAEPALVVNSPRQGVLSNTVNVSFPGRPGPSLVQRFDLEGVAVSHGSACASGSLEPSPALLALGLAPEIARGALRLSVGHANAPGDVAEFARRAARVLEDVGPRAEAR